MKIKFQMTVVWVLCVLGYSSVAGAVDGPSPTGLLCDLLADPSRTAIIPSCPEIHMDRECSDK